MGSWEKSIFWCVSVSTLAVFFPSYAQDEPEDLEEIVTVANRIESPRRQVAGSVAVITAEELARNGQPLLIDALRQTAGLRIARTGGPGQPAYWFLRGARPRQTVIQMDGVSLRSPNDSNGYILGTLSTANVERIEILRGPQSSIYGPDAAGGVINVVTKRGRGEPSTLFYLEGGSMDSLRASLATRGAKDRVNYSLAVDRYETQGVSAARSGTETDPFENDSLHGRFDYELSEASRFSFFVFREDASSDADFGATSDSSAITQKRNYLLRSQWELGREPSERGTTIGFSRKGFHSEDGFGSSYRGHSTELDWRTFGALSDRLTLYAGLEHSDDLGQQMLAWDPAQAIRLRSWGAYFSGRVEISEDFFTEIAVRRDDNDRHSGESTFKAAFSRDLEDGWRVFGSVGSFYGSPNAYFFANALDASNLLPETGMGHDFGVDYVSADGRGKASFVWFERDAEKEFDWLQVTPGIYKVRNAFKTRVHGLEGEVCIPLWESLSLDLALTLQEAENLTEKRDMYSRPRKMFSGTFDWTSPDEVMKVNLGFRALGSRTDVGDMHSPSYTVWNLATTFAARKDWEIHFRMENVLNNDYTEMVDWNGNPYGTFGRSLFLGFSLRH